MTMTPTSTTIPETDRIRLTPRAVERVKLLLAKEADEGVGLRLGVTGGGCSGLSYALKLDRPRSSDLHFEQDGVLYHVDPKSHLYLKGMEVDYEETLMQYGFVFRNPNASHSCSCGSSFTV
jgi:iron-sulfur cluster assembly protein